MQRQNRINNPEKIDFDYINIELQSGKKVIVQFDSNVYTEKKLSQLNELCEKHDENFEVRFYGHYGNSFDCKVLLKISNVKSLSVDCLNNADNVHILSELMHLKKLSFGIFESKDLEILNADNLKQLTELVLIETRTKALNLEYLRDYKSLKYLILGGHTKNIEAVGELSNLEYLAFNSIKKTSVSFVNRLKKLKTLTFILGGRENIHEIEDNEIENLEIVWVRGFNDISNISKFRKLKSLLIEDNIQLYKINFDQALPELSDFKILNCKSLNSLTGLEHLTSLNHLRVYKTDLDFESVVNQKLSKTLKTFAFYTTRKKIDMEIQSQLKKRGYMEYAE